MGAGVRRLVSWFTTLNVGGKITVVVAALIVVGAVAGGLAGTQQKANGGGPPRARPPRSHEPLSAEKAEIRSLCRRVLAATHNPERLKRLAEEADDKVRRGAGPLLRLLAGAIANGQHSQAADYLNRFESTFC